jgi:hypothetical protein
VLDEAAFASGGALPEAAAGKAVELYRVVDAEALSRIDLGIGSVLVLVAMVAGTAAYALAGNAALEEFDKGVTAYQRHEFVTARDAFARVVAAEPASPDAWANLGTAAWAAADTARSVVSWQRALRMEPLATDMRERVEMVHALPANSAGYVVPVPPGWVFNAAAILWCLAWGTAAVRLLRRRPLATRHLATVAVFGGVLAIAGFALADRTSGAHLAVLRRTASLSTDPTLGGDLGPTAIVGEVVRVTGRQGAWTRVRLDDGRDGWLENASIISLDPREGAAAASN